MTDVFELLNLMARQRREGLPAKEQSQLRREVEASAMLRGLQRVSMDFLPLAEVRPQDDELVDHIVDGALSRRQPLRPRPKHRLATPFMLGIAAMLVGASTAFGYWGVPKVYPSLQTWMSRPVARTVSARSRQGMIAPSPTAGMPPKASPTWAGHEGSVPTPAVASASAVGAPALEPQRLSTSGPARSVLGGYAEGGRGVSAPRDEAASLFARAHAARKAGRVNEAIQSLQELQRRFPQSAESAVSHISLGSLLIERGDAERALAQFAQVKGALAEEGLVGQAQAYAKLGLEPEARAVWDQLRRRFPNSVYVRKLRDRASPAGASRPRE